MIRDSLTGKSALVTGASRGIGAELARTLAAQGAFVLVHYSASQNAADKVVGDITAAGGHAVALQADLRDVAAIAGLFQAVDRELAARGHQGLDILINNAGVGGAQTIENTTEELFDTLFDTNAKGPFFVAQHAMPRLVDGGRVVNIGSVVARGANALRAAYSMSKLVIHGLTSHMAADLAPRRITVNCIAAGAVATDFIAGARKLPGFESGVIAMTAFGRLGEPVDIAEAVLLLLQPEAAWITGQVIEAAGGLRL